MRSERELGLGRGQLTEVLLECGPPFNIAKRFIYKLNLGQQFMLVLNLDLYISAFISEKRDIVLILYCFYRACRPTRSL